MKRRGERGGRWGEGGMIATVLAFVLALSLAVCWVRTPVKVTAFPVHAVDFETLRQTELTNLNTASAEKLSRLPGIGQVLAERIVAYREANGPFESVEELLQVEGVGEGKLDGIRNEIYVERRGLE